MIDPALDVWVWVVAFLCLALMGARAWAVETRTTRFSRPGGRVRLLTAATVVAFLGLAGMLTLQGGAQFVSDVITAKTQGELPAAQQAPAAVAPAGN